MLFSWHIYWMGWPIHCNLKHQNWLFSYKMQKTYCWIEYRIITMVGSTFRMLKCNVCLCHINNFIGLGARAVKWTNPDPCLVLSESDSSLYTNFKFCKEKKHIHLNNILMYKSKQFMMIQKFQKKSTYIRFIVNHITFKVKCSNYCYVWIRHNYLMEILLNYHEEKQIHVKFWV